MDEQKRDFKGVWIPKTIWLDTRLNALEKVILTEVDSLDNGERGCWASNKYIADFCQCSETKVSTAISKLIELGYVYVKSFNGRERVLKSRLSNFESQPCKNENADIENLKENNTDNNTPNNTANRDIKEKPKRKRFVPPTLEEVEAYCRERNNNVNAKKFYDYFTASDWYDSKGKKVRSWKQKVITWESYSDGDKKPNNGTGEQKKQTATDEFMAKLKSMYQQGS